MTCMSKGALYWTPKLSVVTMSISAMKDWTRKAATCQKKEYPVFASPSMPGKARRAVLVVV